MLFFDSFGKDTYVTADGYIVYVRKNGFVVLIPKFGMEGTVYINDPKCPSSMGFTYDEDLRTLSKGDKSLTLGVMDKVKYGCPSHSLSKHTSAPACHPPHVHSLLRATLTRHLQGANHGRPRPLDRAQAADVLCRAEHPHRVGAEARPLPVQAKLHGQPRHGRGRTRCFRAEQREEEDGASERGVLQETKNDRGDNRQCQLWHKVVCHYVACITSLLRTTRHLSNKIWNVKFAFARMITAQRLRGMRFVCLHAPTHPSQQRAPMRALALRHLRRENYPESQSNRV